MARIGSFMGPTTPFGVPTDAVHPTDNDITPSAQQAEADALKAAADELYEDLKNATRDPNAQ
jgi:hypothetical protein